MLNNRRYEYIIKREVSYIEEVHAIIVAENEQDAQEIAEGIGLGEGVIHPPVERYNVYDREETHFELISAELARHEAA